MADLKPFEFFLLRYVPDAVKDEFVNIGVVMFETDAKERGFAEVRFTRDWRRVKCLDPLADVEMLEALEREIRAQIALTDDRDSLLRRLEDSFSNLIQLSPTKGCLSENPAREIATMASIYLESARIAVTREASGRQQILGTMREAFEQQDVLGSVMERIPAEPYTKPGDPFHFDFGYRVDGELKLFQAVSLKTNMESGLFLAARYPKIGQGIKRLVNVSPLLTAVIDDGLDRKEKQVSFVLEMMGDENITIAAAAEMPGIAERARLELKV